MIERLDVFLEASRRDMDKVRGNLSEVLLAQGYQDLTGQIIRGVMKLVSELETALVNLVRLSRTAPGAVVAPEPAENLSRGFGPAIPGVDNGPSVSGQSDVDSLLAGLGM
jgi:chemotaxis protein CheZ